MWSKIAEMNNSRESHARSNSKWQCEAVKTSFRVHISLIWESITNVERR